MSPRFWSPTPGLLMIALVVSCRASPPERGPVTPRPRIHVAATPPGPVRRETSFVVDAEPGLHGGLARERVALRVESMPLLELLGQIAESSGLQLIADDRALDGLHVTLRARGLGLGELLEELEATFPVTIEKRGSLLRVEARHGPRLSLLVYPLPGGLVAAELPLAFDSIEQLSFISRSQREEGGEASSPGPGILSGDAAQVSHLEEFLTRLPELLKWPEGSTWFLDRRRNLLFVRSARETLTDVEACLDSLLRPPPVVEIEARFVEVSDDFARDLGVELGLTDVYPFRQDSAGEPKVGLGESTMTRLGIPVTLPGDASGLNLSVLGILTQPRFEAVLRALEVEGDAEVLAAPTIATVNNSRATIAITTNLPYIEDYRPVIENSLVASEGVSATESSVALVAVINDRNFTGIVLNVTPSVGADPEILHLRLQPVIRDQVDSIVIPSSALVEGVETPEIERPIIETRFLDTQLALPSGSTVALGGLKTQEVRTEVRRVPILGSIPLLGLLFRRTVEVRRRRDLLLLVTARVVVGREEPGT